MYLLCWQRSKKLRQEVKKSKRKANISMQCSSVHLLKKYPVPSRDVKHPERVSSLGPTANLKVSTLILSILYESLSI